ncbi:MAG: dihydrofolate reductase family protein [Thermoleophilia bacterium]|nr:dihydrofolate reductase family protein [Thermoleophilia bacterium]
MRKIVYMGQVSIDGYYEDSTGDFSWAEPDEEIHRFTNDVIRQAGASLMGRRMYETMEPHWTEVAANRPGPDYADEFAQAWVETPRYVFSRTLDSVPDGLTLVSGDIEAEVRRLKEMPGGPIDVGGPGLANSLAEFDLIDELLMVVFPVVIGGGKPYLGPNFAGKKWALVEQSKFSSGVPLMRYERVRQ